MNAMKRLKCGNEMEADGGAPLAKVVMEKQLP
jgi:hypothetical protein